MIARLNAALEGRYEIRRELGQGGMATVFLARDVRHDREVALKVLKPELAAVVGAERFLAEIRTTANLQHPHILPLFDSGDADGFLFYVMPYIEGESLRERLDREKQLPIEEAVGIAAKVAGALESAHRQGVVHRDIKPANILLSAGEPLVADFGIALAVQQAGGGRLTETGLSLGTPYYMSPEQATADRDPDPRSDVYSLGSVLYEMLTGEPPFQGTTAQAVLGRILTGQVEPARATRKSVPPHVDAVVVKSLERLPADRFGSAAEFAAALADPSSATRLGAPAAPMGQGRGGGPGWLVPTAGVAALLLLIVAAWGWLRPTPSPASEPVSRYSLGDAGSWEGVSARWWILGLVPDGSGVVISGDRDGRSGLWLRRRGSLEPEFIEGTEGGVNPAVSPDGRRVAFVSGGGSASLSALRVAELDGGGSYTVTDSLVDLGGVSWGDDGYIYYDGHLEGDGVARVPEGGGDPEPVTFTDLAGGELWHLSPWVLPGGRGVLFAVARGDAIAAEDYQVAVVERPGDPHRVLLDKAQYARYLPPGYLLYGRGSTLYAVPFDVEALEITGDPVVVVEDIQVRGWGRAGAVVAPEGSLVYISGPGQTVSITASWVDREGSMEPLSVDFPGIFLEGSLSPDGRYLAAVIREGEVRNIWSVALPDGVPQKLTFQGQNLDPAFTPDGEEILFLTYEMNPSQSRLRQVPRDGQTLPRDLPGTVGRLLAPRYTPDGSDILVTRAVRDPARLRYETVALSPETAEERSLLSGAGSQGAARLSPDGRWLAYQSDESGRWEVYVRPYPDIGRAKRQVSRSGGIRPAWSADGTELFFLSPNLDLYRAAVTAGSSFQAAPPELVVSRRDMVRIGDGSYAVHPDGNRFLIPSVAEGGARQGRIVMVENFVRELEERFAETRR